MDDREAAERFSATVVEFSAAELARAARRTKAAAKGWKDASRAPSLASTINLARQLPTVKAWLYSQVEAEVAEFDAPSTLDATINALQYAAGLPGPAGDEARAILSGKRRS